MLTQRIFISHSRKGDKARKPVEAVARALVEKGFDARFDRDFLEPGDAWYAKISDEMARCHGAILLLDEATQASDYVRHEASVLSQRDRTEGGRFRLLVGLVDPDPAKNTAMMAGGLAKQYEATRLLEKQVFCAPPHLLAGGAGGAGGADGEELPAEALEPLAAALVEKAVAVFGAATRPESPTDFALKELRQWLLTIEPDPREAAQTLDSVADAIPDPSFREGYFRQPLALRPLVFAQWMTSAAIEAPDALAEAFVRLGLSIRRTPFGQKSVLLDMIDVIFSQWVEVDRPSCPLMRALRAVRDAGGAGTGARAMPYSLCCGVEPEFTAKRFPLHCVWPLSRIKFIELTPDAIDETALTSELMAAFDVIPGSPRADRDFTHRVLRKVTVCLLPEGFPACAAHAATLKSVTAAFGAVHFVAWSNDMTHSAVLDPDETIFVEPSIDRVREFEQREAWREVAELFEEG